jgi:hypothetical protein
MGVICYNLGMLLRWRQAITILACLTAVAALGGKIFAPTQSAAAQTEPLELAYPLAQLYALDFQDFPLVRAYLDAYDADRAFIHGLGASDITIFENEQAISPAALLESTPGVQFVVALTFGPAMGIRDGMGRSRFDYLVEGLAAWENAFQTELPDDLSLIVDNGPELIHLKSPAPILEALQQLQIEPRQALPSLQPLSRAVESALDPTDRPGMKRAVLFITPPQPPESIAGMQSLSSQAFQAGIRIFIWQVSAPEDVSLPSAQQLARMANQTGGAFYNYSALEPVPEIQAYLEPLRFTYQLTYRSAITSSGEFAVAAEVQHNDLAILSPPQAINLSILPPNPVFIALPSRIERLQEIPAPQIEGELVVETEPSC